MLDHLSSLSLYHHLWDVPQTISCFFDKDQNRLNNSLGISSYSEIWFKIILQHYSGYHLVHDKHGSLWGQVFTSGIYQLHRVEICTSRYLINNRCLSVGVTPFAMNNQLLVLPNKFHHLMQSRRHNSSHMYERPSQQKVIDGVNVQDLKLCIEFWRIHLDDQIHCPQRISLNFVEVSFIDLVLFQLPKVKPYLPQCLQQAYIHTRSIIHENAIYDLLTAYDSDVHCLIV